jgi:uncharacterized protein (UPF0210 family)
MPTFRSTRALFVLLLITVSAAAQTAPLPKVRAITAFIRIDRANYRTKVDDALKMLLATRDAFATAGYETQTVRIVTQPFPEYTRGMSRADAAAFLREFDAYVNTAATAAKVSIATNIGPAMRSADDDSSAAELLGDVLGSATFNSSIIVAGDDGIHWNAVRASARLIKRLEQTPHSDGTFKFAAVAMLAPFAPFFPGAWHDSAGHQFSIGLEGAGLVDQAFSAANHDPKLALQKLTALLTEQGRVVERIGQQIEQQTGWLYLGFDPTPAPLKDVSIGAAMEKFVGGPFGSSGTMTAAAIITQAVRAVPVRQIGYSGLMLPVLEDARMAQRWSEGTFHIDSLLAYSSVCGTGLDTVPLPGDVSEEQLARIIGDVASLAVKWHKPLTARLQPVAGKKAGEKSDFNGPFLVNAVLQPLP